MWLPFYLLLIFKIAIFHFLKENQNIKANDRIYFGIRIIIFDHLLLYFDFLLGNEILQS